MAKTRKKIQKLLDPLETAIEAALDPGQFIGYNLTFSFVRALEEVELEIAALVKDESVRAADLYETFPAGCNKKIEELDDSGGNLGVFVSDLFRGWVKHEKSPAPIRARLRAAADRELEALSHYVTEPIAEKLKTKHPETAASMYSAMGMRILNAGKSKYCDIKT